MLPVALTTSARTRSAFALTGFSKVAIGRAATAIPSVSGIKMIIDQVSSDEVIWLTRARSAGSAPARSADRASTGISAGQRATKNQLIDEVGTWFAVT